MEDLRKYKIIWDQYTEGWMGSVIYLVLGFVIAYLVNMGLGYALNTNTPVVAVFSESMVPTYFKGDMIVVYGTDELSVGDVIIFEAPDKPYPIIHRIYEINSDGTILTKGDNNPAVDNWNPPITENNVYGKAILTFPLLGWVKIAFVEVTGLA